MGSLQKALSRKYLLYIKKGLTHEEASNKLLRKFVHKKHHHQQQDNLHSGYFEQEMYAKMKKALGFTFEDSHNTIQIKNEIDKLVGGEN